MIVYAAIDVRGGRVVQLVGGRPDQERVNLPDPVAIARGFVAHGFSALHVVDLDGALGEGNNAVAVKAIIDTVDVPVQVGGGVRSSDAVRRWLRSGAARVTVGTRAVEDFDWLRDTAARFPDRIVVAADVRENAIVTHGWTRTSETRVEKFLDTVDALPLAAVLVTDVGREGRLEGVDAELFNALARNTRLPIVAAGGISSLRDLRALDGAGVAGVVVGTALYTGAIDCRAAAQEFGHEQVSQEN